jgi:hypothetical protein
MKLKSWFTGTWKNWGDHPLIVFSTLIIGIAGIGYTIYTTHFKDDPKAIFSQRVLSAETSLESMPPDSPMKFPLGVNSPLKSTQTTSSSNEKFESIQYYDESSKTFKNFTPREMVDFLRARKDVLYGQMLDTDAQTNTVHTINLKVRNIRTNQIYVLKYVSASDVLRDIVNATLNNKVTDNPY